MTVPALDPAPAGRQARRLSSRGAEGAVDKLVEVALRRYAMIEEGDRILLAVSGGKDSMALASDLGAKRRWWPLRYELKALHIATEFGDPATPAGLASLLGDWDIPFQSISVSVQGRLKTGRSMNCYWCSTQRRTELIRYAMEHGFNKIALGHHLDDAVETLLMNMLYKGEIGGMLPLLRYRKYPLSIIRPLILCEERQLIEYGTEKGYMSTVCSCDYGGESKRREVRSRVAVLTGNSGRIKRRIFESTGRINFEYLPGGQAFASSAPGPNREGDA
ncbi:MAG: tRNA 2-thiocytidine biosynthesis TtcA family protein [Spirochaetia bacterium]|nr:tRNA 2-thiocytidine biosynthesis TtcA family protein [Spirochaetia bacterium]